MVRYCQNSVAYDINQIAGTVEAISSVMTMRPPNLSVQMPNGTRINEPVSTGVAINRPNWVELRSSVFLIGMPITANIIHTMKHTVKAKVLTISTDRACPFLVMSNSFLECYDSKLADLCAISLLRTPVLSKSNYISLDATSSKELAECVCMGCLR